MDEKVTAGSAITAVQEASEKICEEDYREMKEAFIRYLVEKTLEKGNNYES